MGCDSGDPKNNRVLGKEDQIMVKVSVTVPPPLDFSYRGGSGLNGDPPPPPIQVYLKPQNVPSSEIEFLQIQVVKTGIPVVAQRK